MRRAYANTVSAAHFIRSTQGARGFYAGFGPAFFIYMAMSYESLLESVRDTKRVAYYQYHEYLTKKELEKNAVEIQKYQDYNDSLEAKIDKEAKYD